MKLAAIEQPPVEFKSARAMFEETLKHEKFVTASIYTLVDLAVLRKGSRDKQLLEMVCG